MSNPNWEGRFGLLLFSETLNNNSVLRFIIKPQVALPGVCLSSVPSKGGGVIWPSLLCGHWESGPIHGYSSIRGFI